MREKISESSWPGIFKSRSPQMNTDETQIHQNSSPICVNLCKSVADFSFSTLMSNRFVKSLFLCISLILLASSSNFSAAEVKTVDDFRAAAAKANAVLTIPDWEQTPEAVEASMKDAITRANAALDQIGSQDLSKVTFKSTIV